MVPKFKSGELVRLKSGGPVLTVAPSVVGEDYEGFVEVEWFAGEVLVRDAIHEDSLEVHPRAFQSDLRRERPVKTSKLDWGV